MKVIFATVVIFVLILFSIPDNSSAIEVAPRISDREIIEKLSALDAKIDKVHMELKGDIKELNAGQKALQQQIADLKRGQEKLEGGQEKLEGRIDALIYAVLGGFITLFAIISVFIGIVIWDRRTALSPAIRKNKELEEREDKVEKALKEYAFKEPRLAEILRNVGIM